MRYIFSSMLSLMILVTACSAVTSAKTSNPLQMIMSQSDATYKINTVYDLNGECVEIPANCNVVISRRGKICNGELVGQNTTIKCAKETIGVKLKGTWQTKKINDAWFDGRYLSDDDIMDNINILQSDSISQFIFIGAKNLYSCSVQNGIVIHLSSNTKLRLNTTIRLKANDLKKYSIISIRDKHSVSVKGGNLIGDVLDHIEPKSGSAGEWGMGVRIINSKNVTLENINISHCWGDGVYVGGLSENKIGDYDFASKNVLLKNIVCDDNRRQGMSVTHVDGLTVKKCSFINTGQTKFTQPGAGVDIEPNIEDGQNESCRNISFTNCTFEHNKGSAFIQYNSIQTRSANSIENIVVENSRFLGLVLICVPSIAFRNSNMDNLFIHINSSNVNVVFEQCTIKSTNSRIREKAPKRGFEGRISITMNRCELLLFDADEWFDSKKWNKQDELVINNSTITIPERLKSHAEAIDIYTKSSVIKYE